MEAKYKFKYSTTKHAAYLEYIERNKNEAQSRKKNAVWC